MSDPEKATVHFTIPGAPTTTAQQKGICVRRGKVMVFTKSAVKQEANRLRAYCLQHRIAHPMAGPLYVEVRIIFPMTQEQIKEHVEHLDDGSFTIFKITRPDVDNAAKLVVDQLTKALFWNDDAQIADLFLRKRAGSEPKITVTIRPATLGCLP